MMHSYYRQDEHATYPYPCIVVDRPDLERCVEEAEFVMARMLIFGPCPVLVQSMKGTIQLVATLTDVDVDRHRQYRYQAQTHVPEYDHSAQYDYDRSI